MTSNGPEKKSPAPSPSPLANGTDGALSPPAGGAIGAAAAAGKTIGQLNQQTGGNQIQAVVLNNPQQFPDANVRQVPAQPVAPYITILADRDSKELKEDIDAFKKRAVIAFDNVVTNPFSMYLHRCYRTITKKFEEKHAMLMQEVLQSVRIEDEEARMLHAVDESYRSMVHHEEETMQLLQDLNSMRLRHDLAGRTKEAALNTITELDTWLRAIEHCASVARRRAAGKGAAIGGPLSQLRTDMFKIKKRLQHQSYSIACIGLEKAGKSTAMSLLMCGELLPTDWKRCTLVPTRVVRSKDSEWGFIVTPTSEEERRSREQMLREKREAERKVQQAKAQRDEASKISDRDDKHPVLLEDDIKTLMREGRFEKRSSDMAAVKKALAPWVQTDQGSALVQTLEVHVPRFLFRGFDLSIVDTPGFNSAVALHGNVTKEAMREADAILYVKSVLDNAGIETTEKGFISELQGDGMLDKCLVFLTKSDRLEEPVVEKIDFAMNQLEEQGFVRERIYQTDCLRALRGLPERLKEEAKFDAFRRANQPSASAAAAAAAGSAPTDKASAADSKRDDAGKGAAPTMNGSGPSINLATRRPIAFDSLYTPTGDSEIDRFLQELAKLAIEDLPRRCIDAVNGFVDQARKLHQLVKGQLESLFPKLIDVDPKLVADLIQREIQQAWESKWKAKIKAMFDQMQITQSKHCIHGNDLRDIQQRWRDIFREDVSRLLDHAHTNFIVWVETQPSAFGSFNMEKLIADYRDELAFKLQDQFELTADKIGTDIHKLLRDFFEMAISFFERGLSPRLIKTLQQEFVQPVEHCHVAMRTRFVDFSGLINGLIRFRPQNPKHYRRDETDPLETIYTTRR